MGYWVIGFQGLTGKDYECRVYDDGVSGTSRLTGSVDVFVTDEDTDEDRFVPVRLQSGYLRFLDTDDAQWRSILPSYSGEKRVVLLSNGVVKWQGWLQARSYGGSYLVTPQVRSLAVECDLSVLRCYDIEPSAGDIVNFAFALHYILSKVDHWDTLYFQGQDAEYWLTRKFLWSVFSELDHEGHQEATYNCLEALEEICKFFGWSCRTSGADLYFCASDASDISPTGWTTLDMQSLYELSTGQGTQAGSASWIGDDFPACCDMDSREEVLLGWRQATVVATTGWTDLLTSLDFRMLEEMYRAHAVTDDHSYSDPNLHHYTLYSNISEWVAPYTPYVYEFGQATCSVFWCAAGSYASFIVEDWFKGDPSTKHNYDWSTKLELEGDWSANPDWQRGDPTCLARFELTGVYPLSNGVFTIDGATENWIVSGGNYIQMNRYGYLECRLIIGDHYWNGSQWLTVPSSPNLIGTFNMYYGPEDHVDIAGTGKIQDTRDLNSQYMPFTGCGIPVGSGIGGRIIFEICSVHNNGTGVVDRLYLSSLQFGFVKRKTATELSRSDTNRYTSANGKKFEKRVTVDTIFASDNDNDYGENIILLPGGAYCSELPYTDSQQSTEWEHPEQWLANRIARYGRTVKRLVTLRALDTASTGVGTAGDVTPRWKLEDSLGDRFWAMSVRREWCDGVVEVVLSEE